MSSLNIIFLGPPGAGKGTVAKNIVERFGVPHISTGDMLRSAVLSGSALGKKVKEVLDSGQLVSDDLMIDLVKSRLSESDCENGILLDGYPRTVNQANVLEGIMKDLERKITHVIFLDVSEEEVVKRISNRRVCPKCGRVYNLITLKPETANICDNDSHVLVQREDDKEDTVRNRYKLYLENTSPLIEFYKAGKKLFTIDGAQSIDNVTEIVFNTLKGD